MSPPKYDQVVEDCDAALKCDPNYIKALNRRAGALEALERFEESLRGVHSSFSSSSALCSNSNSRFYSLNHS
jgi:import receptor subunit TOM70